jgi:hypothetical protein
MAQEGRKCACGKPVDGKRKRCSECQKQFEKEAAHRYQATWYAKHKASAPAGKLVSKGRLPSETATGIITDSLVLRMLVAAGMVTESKVEKAREMIRELAAA